MFRPCIDLHEGKVKQIVGGTLGANPDAPLTHFVSDRPAAWFADLYRRDHLQGGHVIMLGPNNEAQARDALRTYPGGLQIGGGIKLDNASAWLDAGASHVIVTSWVFPAADIDWDRLQQLSRHIGKSRLVLDLSCRRDADRYVVMADRWTRFTSLTVDAATLEKLSAWCAEFLVHAVDVEGLCRGIDPELVKLLHTCSPLPATYAGGASSLADLELVTALSQGRIDLTIGSALDIFGGTGVRYAEVVAFNKNYRARRSLDHPQN